MAWVLISWTGCKSCQFPHLWVKIIDMCFYICWSCDFPLLLAKSLRNFRYAYPNPLVFFVPNMCFPLIFPRDNTVLQYCHSWSQGCDLDFITSASYSVLVCCQALDMLSEMWRWGRGQNAILEPSWVCGFKPTHFIPNLTLRLPAIFIFYGCITSHHRLRGLKLYPFSIS